MNLLTFTRSKKSHYPFNNYFPHLKRFYSYPNFRPGNDENLFFHHAKDLIFSPVNADLASQYMEERDELIYSSLLKYKEKVTQTILEGNYPLESPNQEDLKDVQALKSFLKAELEELKAIRKEFFNFFYQRFSEIYLEGSYEFNQKLNLIIDLNWDYFEAHPELLDRWSYNYLSQSPFLTPEIFRKYSDQPWRHYYLSKRDDYDDFIDSIDEINENDIDYDEWDKLSSNPKLNMALVESLSSRSWNWASLSQLPNFDHAMVERILERFEEENDEFILDWTSFSSYPHLDLNFVLQNLDLSWDWGRISSNPQLDFSFVEAHPNYPWDWMYLSSRPDLDFNFVGSHPEYPWKWGALSYHPKLKFSFVQSHSNRSWNWKVLSRLKDLDLNFVKANRNLPWDWKELSTKPNFDFSLIEENPFWKREKEDDLSMIRPPSTMPSQEPKEVYEWVWNWGFLSSNRKFISTYLEKYPGWPWDWDVLSSNQEVISTYLEEYPGWSWNWDTLSSNYDLDFSLVEKLKHKPWNNKHLALNPNLDISILEKRLGKEIEDYYKLLSQNSKINLDYIKQHPSQSWDQKFINYRFNLNETEVPEIDNYSYYSDKFFDPYYSNPKSRSEKLFFSTADVYQLRLKIDKSFPHLQEVRERLKDDHIVERIRDLEKIEARLRKRQAYQEETEKLDLIDTLSDLREEYEEKKFKPEFIDSLIGRYNEDTGSTLPLVPDEIDLKRLLRQILILDPSTNEWDLSFSPSRDLLRYLTNL